MNKNSVNRYSKKNRKSVFFSRFFLIAGIGLLCCLFAVLGVVIVRAIFPAEGVAPPVSAGSGGNIESTALSSQPPEKSEPSSEPPERQSSLPAEQSSGLEISESSDIIAGNMSMDPEVIPDPPVVTELGDFSDALFIGDSRTEALKTFVLADGASFLANRGLMVNTFFTKPVIRTKGGTVTVAQALKQEPQHKRVFIMLGVNELGWPSIANFIDYYSQVIDAVKASQPNADIYVQAILPVSKKKSAQDSVYNNPRINKFNKQIKKMAADKGVTYLAVNEALMDTTGSLPPGASTDGVHPNSDYCKVWVSYLNQHTKGN